MAKTNSRGDYRRKTEKQEFIRRILKDQKFQGKEFCIDYSIKVVGGSTINKSKGPLLRLRPMPVEEGTLLSTTMP